MVNPVIIFVHIPKTAGTSLSFILHNTFLLSHCHTDHSKKKVFSVEDFQKANQVFFRLKSLHGHGFINAADNFPENFILYTFLRDPIMRTVSEYQADVIQGGQKKSFEEWISEKSRHNAHVKMIAGVENLEKAKTILAEKYIFVGLTEKFQESLDALNYYLPYALDTNTIKKKNVAFSNEIKNSILNNPDYVEMLRQANKLDIELYEYVKTELYPELTSKVPADYLKNGKPHRSPRFRYRISVAYNSFVYRQLYKVSNKLRHIPRPKLS